MYGLPKIHKPGPLKMRPIVSNVGAVTSLLSKWLVSTFKEFGSLEGRNVTNSQEFIERIQGLNLRRSEALVSFDIVSLFPNVPVDRAIGFLEEWLLDKGVGVERTTDLINLTRLCMDHNDFQFRGVFYRMLHGTAMGNSLSPFLAEVFLSRLESDSTA